jgi:hypothetical protein
VQAIRRSCSISRPAWHWLINSAVCGACQRLKAVKTGLLTVNTVHQLLAQLIAELPRAKPDAPARAPAPPALSPA